MAKVPDAARAFYRVLAIAYAVGFLLHVADVFGWRLRLENLPPLERGWILFLLLGDAVAAAGLWRGRRWGIAAFVVIAIAQLTAYGGFPEYFGSEPFLIGFHLLSLGVFAGIRWNASA